MSWRFMEENFDKMPDLHLEQLKPLNEDASEFLWKFIQGNKLHEDAPFKKGLFRNLDKAEVREGNQKEVKRWLF